MLRLDQAREAKILLEQALSIYRYFCDDTYFKVATILVDLSIIYGYFGNVQEQKALLEIALPILMSHYGERHPRVAIALGNLGNVFGILGDDLNQRALLERALPILVRYHGKNHPSVAAVLGSLGNAYSKFDVQLQKVLLEYAQTIYERCGNRLEIARTLFSLSNVYRALGDFLKQKESLESALDIVRRMYGYRDKEHPEAAKILVNLGDACGKLGYIKQEKMLIKRALPTLEDHYGERHILVAIALVNLSNVYATLRKLQQQKILLERALIIITLHYGEHHDEVLQAQHALNAVNRELGNISQAETPAVQDGYYFYPYPNVDISYQMQAYQRYTGYYQPSFDTYGISYQMQAYEKYAGYHHRSFNAHYPEVIRTRASSPGKGRGPVPYSFPNLGIQHKAIPNGSRKKLAIRDPETGKEIRKPFSCSASCPMSYGSYMQKLLRQDNIHQTLNVDAIYRDRLDEVLDALHESKLMATEQGLEGRPEIDNWVLEDVHNNAHCFYYAVVHHMRLIGHPFLSSVPEDTTPYYYLRLYVEGGGFQDRVWAEDEIIEQAVIRLNVILAVVDTRRPYMGFTTYYRGEDGDILTNAGNDTTLQMPSDRSIIRLAGTGNYFLSVTMHPALKTGALQQAFNRDATSPATVFLSTAPNATLFTDQGAATSSSTSIENSPTSLGHEGASM